MDIAHPYLENHAAYGYNSNLCSIAQACVVALRREGETALFTSKDSIEEDLTRAKHSFYEAGLISSGEPIKQEQPRADIQDEPLGFSDFFVLWRVAIAVILPWVLTFVALLGLVGFLLAWWLG